MSGAGTSANYFCPECGCVYAFAHYQGCSRGMVNTAPAKTVQLTGSSALGVELQVLRAEVQRLEATGWEKDKLITELAEASASYLASDGSEGLYDAAEMIKARARMNSGIIRAREGLKE